MDESEDEEDLRNPNLDIAQLKFTLTLPENFENETTKKKLYDYIVDDDMTPYYEIVCNDLQWKVDNDVLNAMKENNMKAIEEYDKEIDYALNNLTAVDIKYSYLNKGNYLSKIGDKENAIKVLRQAYDVTISLRSKLDNVFHCIRIGLFFMDLELIKVYLQEAEGLIALGADWHSRNCYQMLKALYSLTIRDFTTATTLLSNAVSTFVCTEIITYKDFMKYAVISAVLILNRGVLKQKILDNSDVQPALHDDIVLKEYLDSLYNSDYKLFFLRLGDIEVFMKNDMFLNRHYKFYVREMKAKAYNQLLSSYISVKIPYMAEQFGVSTDYIENEVSRLIVAKKLNYKIDKVSNTIVNMAKMDKTNIFRVVIKHGDLLLNRIHKLSRVINV